MWLPPQTSALAFLNQMVFIVLSALTAFNFFMAAVMGPSYLPYGWKPKNKKHESYLQLCTICPSTYKAPRAHHCRKCDRCVAKMVRMIQFSFAKTINQVFCFRIIIACIWTIVSVMVITRILFGFFRSPLLAAHMPLLSSSVRFTLGFIVTIMFTTSNTAGQLSGSPRGA